MGEQIIYGSSIKKNRIPKVDESFIVYPGESLFSKRTNFGMIEDVFNKHILLLGCSGCGKTNTFLYTLKQIREQITERDILIIFDTKGEFYDNFYQEGDYIIGNSHRFRNLSNTWNIFDEILADGNDPIDIKINAKEIASSLFHGRGSQTQPFFCNAARDIFMGMLLHFIRSAERLPDKWKDRLNNKSLADALRKTDIKTYKEIFSFYEDLRFILTYFGDGKSNQALGVFGELNSMVSEYFIGIFAEHRPKKSISMRNAVRDAGAKALFIEYDLSVGEVLSPVYRLLVDQALKEALGRKDEKGGRVFLIADEFKLLPKLQHIDDALNFGRGLGMYVMAGIQSINQLYDVYGKEKGTVIASGFGSVFAFHTNDMASRSYIMERFGTNVISYSYINEANDTPYVQERNGNTAEIWDQINLIIGQAVIGLGELPPFVFRFSEYKKRNDVNVR